MSTSPTPESGLRTGRIWVLREAVTGEIPTDPSWEHHSDNYLEVTWSPDAGVERQDGLGTPDPRGFFAGNEEHEMTVSYDLQRPLLQGEDYAADAFLRDADNSMLNTHAMVVRDDRVASGPDDPTGTQGARQYLVAKGGYPEGSIEGDPSEGTPIPVELTYLFEKVRSYVIYQPDAATAITVESTNPDDVGLSVTIEDEGAATQETISLTEETDADGNFVAANATTTATFGDIDAVEAESEPMGNLDVRLDGGATITTIYGAYEYSDDDQPLEGDLGVPALGAGSAASEIGTSYENFHGDSVQRPAGEDFVFDLNNLTVEVENNFDSTPRNDSTRHRITAGNRSTTWEADVIGEHESHDLIMGMLRTVGADLEWSLSNSTIVGPAATVTDSPERTRESEQAAAEMGVTLESNGLNLVA